MSSCCFYLQAALALIGAIVIAAGVLVALEKKSDQDD